MFRFPTALMKCLRLALPEERLQTSTPLNFTGIGFVNGLWSHAYVWERLGGMT